MAKKATRKYKPALKSKPINWKRFGHYAFIVGILLGIALALVTEVPERPVVVTLVILGLVVGLLNITAKETTEFLIAALVLMVSASTTVLILGEIHAVLIAMWRNVLTFIGPAAIVVAIKAVLEMAERR